MKRNFEDDRIEERESPNQGKRPCCSHLEKFGDREVQLEKSDDSEVFIRDKSVDEGNTILKKSADQEVIILEKSDDQEVIILEKSNDQEVIILDKSGDEEATILKKSEDQEIIILEKSNDQEVIILDKSGDEEATILKKSEDQEIIILETSDDQEVIILEKSDDNEDFIVQISDDHEVLERVYDDQRIFIPKNSDDQEALIPENCNNREVFIPKKSDDQEALIPENCNNREVFIPKKSDDQEALIPENCNNREVFIPEKSDDQIVLEKSNDQNVLEKSNDQNVLQKKSNDQNVLEKKSNDQNVLQKKSNDQEVLRKTSVLIQKHGRPRSSTDEYEILKFLGEGGFGKVGKCLKKRTNEVVALKIFQFRHRSLFLRESTILCKINRENPDEFNFVRNIENFTYEKHHFMVFELLEKSLLDYMEEHELLPLPMEGIRYVTQQLLVAQSKLRDLRIIHGDIKPENIMLVNHKQQPFRIKIIDFNLSVELPTTRYNTKLGTLNYRAPEIILGRKYCETADMWSTGCTIAEMLTGDVLYPSDIEYDQIRFIDELQGPFPDHMLQSNQTAAEYFCAEKGEDSDQCKWRIKNPKEYERDTGKTPTDFRKYHLKNLETLVQVCSVIRKVHKEEDAADTKHCVDMLKKMLKINQEDRISPDNALECNFISSRKQSSN